MEESIFFEIPIFSTVIHTLVVHVEFSRLLVGIPNLGTKRLFEDSLPFFPVNHLLQFLFSSDLYPSSAVKWVYFQIRNTIVGVLLFSKIVEVWLNLDESS